MRLAAHGSQDADGAQPAFDDAFVAEEGHERQQVPRHLRAMQHDAERAPDGAEHFQHVVGNGPIRERRPPWVATRCYAWYGSAPLHDGNVRLHVLVDNLAADGPRRIGQSRGASGAYQSSPKGASTG